MLNLTRSIPNWSLLCSLLLFSASLKRPSPREASLGSGVSRRNVQHLGIGDNPPRAQVFMSAKTLISSEYASSETYLLPPPFHNRDQIDLQAAGQASLR
jgi:hypothetical protein